MIKFQVGEDRWGIRERVRWILMLEDKKVYSDLGSSNLDVVTRERTVIIQLVEGANGGAPRSST